MPEKIELEKIRVPEWAIRTVMDEGKLRELANSIEAHELIEPIVVRLTSDGHYELISGYRRLQALKVLNAKEVEAKVVECTDEEALALSIEENEKRTNEHPFDVARKIAYMREKLGLSTREIAKRLGKEESWVSMMLKINAIDEEAKKVLAPKVRDIGKLYAIATINSPEKQRIAADYLVKRNLRRKEVEDLAKQANPMPVEEFRAYCERLLKEEGEEHEERAEGAGGFQHVETPPGKVQPPTQGPQTSQEQGEAPETRECYLCGEERGRKEIRFYAICKDRHSGLHELMRDVRRYGSDDVDHVLEVESDIRHFLLTLPKEERGKVVEEVKRWLAQNQD
jgi:ParB/RepB/Spo0J family partition protein